MACTTTRSSRRTTVRTLKDQTDVLNQTLAAGFGDKMPSLSPQQRVSTHALSPDGQDDRQNDRQQSRSRSRSKSSEKEQEYREESESTSTKGNKAKKSKHEDVHALLRCLRVSQMRLAVGVEIDGRGGVRQVLMTQTTLSMLSSNASSA